jgi:hypothetical protein
MLGILLRGSIVSARYLKNDLPRVARASTHHVVRNDCPMPIIDLDTIGAKDSRHLVDDTRSARFHSVSLEDGVNVTRVEFVQIDEFVG